MRHSSEGSDATDSINQAFGACRGLTGLPWGAPRDCSLQETLTPAGTVLSYFCGLFLAAFLTQILSLFNKNITRCTFQWGVLVIKSTEQNPEGRILSDVFWKESKQSTQSNNVLLEIALCGKAECTEKDISVIQPEYKSQNSSQYRTGVTSPEREGLTVDTERTCLPSPRKLCHLPTSFPLHGPHPNLAKVPNTNISKILLRKCAEPTCQ